MENNECTIVARKETSLSESQKGMQREDVSGGDGIPLQMVVIMQDV